MAKILIADDEQKMRHLLSMILESAGHAVESVGDGSQAFSLLQEARFDMVITDIKMPVMTGMELLHEIKKADIPCPVIIITAFATIDSAVESMRLGASDFITKPFETDQIHLAVERTLNISRLIGENRALKETIEEIGWKTKIIYKSEQMDELLELAKNVAQSDSAVLLQGESGTGKELIARFVHESSPRKENRFVPINCAAISSSLVESEMFGHEKGAFTGAEKRAIGKFEYASKGTLFLDEIGDLPKDIQAKLLRVLQERRINRVGGNTEIETDVRVVCATNQDLKKLVAEGKFREDLYYRINVLPLVTPPLRERKDDIMPLAEYFLSGHEKGRNKSFSDDAKALLVAHDWPGNVRELANAVERGVILSGQKSVIDSAVLSFIDTHRSQPACDPGEFQLPPQGVDLEKMITQMALQALEATNGNQSEAAKRLGLTRAKFRIIIKQVNVKNES